MSCDQARRPPIFYRSCIRLASLVAPRYGRVEFLARWTSILASFWILVERGELAGSAGLQAARLCRAAVADAFCLRFSPIPVRGWVRGPVFPLLAGAVVVGLAAAVTNGFAAVRAVVAMARSLQTRPPLALPYDPRGDTIFAFSLPIVFALASGIALVAIARFSLHGRSWRYWPYLAAKTFLVMLILPLLWIEGGTALRAHFGPITLPIGCLLIAGAMLFVAAFSYCLLWVFADQQRRCPVCLRRLSMPVSIGSWASVFDPVATELLCDEGHGSLCIPDSQGGPPQRWITLDASWRVLF